MRFDSGNLGFGPAGATAAANRATWRTPRNLAPGTYTYFCKIHPFMRGAFRVKARAKPTLRRSVAAAVAQRHAHVALVAPRAARA